MFKVPILSVTFVLAGFNVTLLLKKSLLAGFLFFLLLSKKKFIVCFVFFSPLIGYTFDDVRKFYQENKNDHLLKYFRVVTNFYFILLSHSPDLRFFVVPVRFFVLAPLSFFEDNLE